MSTLRIESNWINALRIPLMIMVVISHCVTILTPKAPIDYSSLGSFVFSFSELIFLKCGAISVATFSVISGYFLFRKFSLEFTTSLFLNESKKRLFSLVLPYILWNLITWAFLWAKNTIALQVGFEPGFSDIEYALVLPFSSRGVMLGPINGSLWYVREIIKLTALSPIIYLLIRYTKGWFVLAWYFLCAFYTPTAGLSNPISVHFCIGAFLGLHSDSLLNPQNTVLGNWGKVHQKYYKLILYTVAITFLGITTLGNQVSWYSYAINLGMPFVVFSIFSLAPVIFENKKLLTYSLRYGNATFFIYATHTLGIITLVRGLLYMTPLLDSPWGQLIICLTLCFSALVYSIIGHRVLSKLAPNLLGVLCGGRA